jgi:DNA-binding PadR family transcriptional regulator
MATLLSLRVPHYGYALLQTLQSKGIDIEANTLYPLLRRLEEQALLTSSWDTTDKRPRKYYAISRKGEQTLYVLLAEWKKMQNSIESMQRRDG